MVGTGVTYAEHGLPEEYSQRGGHNNTRMTYPLGLFNNSYYCDQFVSVVPPKLMYNSIINCNVIKNYS